MKTPIFTAGCALLALTFCTVSRGQESPAQSPAAAEPVKDVRVVFHTDKGDIEATLFASAAPIATANFLNLAQHKFYDGLKFHRVVADFMIQGGDPRGTGSGGPGYRFEDEPNGPRKFDKPGVVAMANAGANTNGSQFFITHVPVDNLDDGKGNGHYTIFGQTTKGQEVVNAIRIGDHIKSVDVLDSAAPLLKAQAVKVKEWDAFLTNANH